MVEELKGKNGKIVGSEEYFKKIGEKEIAKDFIEKRINSSSPSLSQYIAKYAIMLYKKEQNKLSTSNLNKLKNLEKKEKGILTANLTVKQKKESDFLKNLELVLINEIHQSMQRITDIIKKDIDAQIGRDKYIIYENRQRLHGALSFLKLYGIDNLPFFEKKLLKYRRLEDFHNKVISLSFKGDQYPVEVELKWMLGKNILIIHPKVKFSFVNGDLEKKIQKDYFDIRKKETLKAFEEWSGKYERVFKTQEGAQSVIVECNPEEATEGKALEVNIIVDIERIIHAAGTTETLSKKDWSPKEASFMNLYLDDYITTITKTDKNHRYYMKSVSKHEFGHVLGLMDAYWLSSPKDRDVSQPKDYESYPDIKEEIEAGILSQAEITIAGETMPFTRMVMNDMYGNISNNDIEMLILAWQKGQSQYYFPIGSDTETSEAMGK